MITDAIISIIIQMGIVVLLCIGFTFTYQIERARPNFAHIGFTLIGTAITFTMTKLMRVYKRPMLKLVGTLLLGENSETSVILTLKDTLSLKK